MKNFINTNRIKIVAAATIILASITQLSNAQIPPNAVNADPSAKSITRSPLGSSIDGLAVLKFRFSNEATSVNSTGQIPPNSVRLTISFPGQYTFHSVNSIPKFVMEDAENTPFGVVHLVNNALILEGEVNDLLLNVKGITPGSGTVTFNADRITPIIVGNTQTANDNASSVFNTIGVLPLNLLSFNAQKQNCTANLAWKTANEENVEGFAVEMSNDNGISFTTIGTIAATNGSAEKNYAFTYQMQNSNPYLFRLKIISKNANIMYGPIARLNAGCGNVPDKSIIVYPSPAKSTVTLNVPDENMYNTKASVIDVNGRIQMGFLITGTAVKLDVSKLAAGIYIIRLANGATTRFMKE